MRQGIKRGSPAAIDSKHHRVADRPLVFTDDTDDTEQTLPKPGGRKGKMGPKKIPSFNTDTTPRRANQKPRRKKQRASTEIVRGARLALAEAILREMKVLGMTPLANRLPKNKGGRGYAQLDTIDQLAARHKKGMENIQAGKRTISDKDYQKDRHIQTTPRHRTAQFDPGTGNYMNRGRKPPPT